MSRLLDRAFARAAKLPRSEQEAFARWILAEIREDERWSRAFASSQDELAALAEEALAEHRTGKTRKLVPGRM
jgi:hypothetical protein